MQTLFWILGLVLSTHATGLLSNFTYDVLAGKNDGELWVLCRGDADSANGWSKLQVGLSDAGVQVNQFTGYAFPADWVGVHDNIFLELTGEVRRSVSAQFNGQVIAQGFGQDSVKGLTVPGALLIQEGDSTRLERVLAGGLDSLAAYASVKPVDVAAHSFSVSKEGYLWLARGPWGIVKSAAPNSIAFPDSLVNYGLDSKAMRFREIDSVDAKNRLAVWSLKIDTVRGVTWVASESGLWRGSLNVLGALQKVAQGGLDSARITGVWVSPSGFSIIVESSRLDKSSKSERTKSALWRSTNAGASFELLKMPYDTLDVSVSSVAFVGAEAWLSVQGIGNNNLGLIRVGANGPLKWTDYIKTTNSNSEVSPWLWGLEAMVIDRNVVVTGVTSFLLGKDAQGNDRLGLAVSTNGAGVAISADSGASWVQVLNQKAVKGGLAEVRMIPSVMRFYGTESLIAYRLDQQAKVTIEVFSYDMRKVRTVVKNALRRADAIRSSVAGQDFWNGRDDAGNPVAVGMYFVRVRDDKGHEAFGKVMWLGAPR